MFIKTIDGEYWNLSQAEGIAAGENGSLLLIYPDKKVLIQKYSTQAEATEMLTEIMQHEKFSSIETLEGVLDEYRKWKSML
ncbi:MAG: hypothetical protein LUD12_13295 [Lachnospiraceae bacterium]|nr:hypothetical protein [Lachnospiraceae bacterium]